ncbi:hypothetical protein ACH47C_38940 [Streptomyces rishiriensis]|uniref:hypothetical protein n=1 Tax=Streptomyces rishiriensis TaxID=68264 RepID=UPI00379BDB22
MTGEPQRDWPPLIWTLKDGYQFCADPDQLQAYEVAVIRGKLTEIRRFITGTVAPHAALQPKGRWIKHLNAQLSSVESRLDIIADFTDAWPVRTVACLGARRSGPSSEGREPRCRAGAAIPPTPGTTNGR